MDGIDLEAACKKATGMNVDDFADYTLEVTKEILRREYAIADAVKELNKFMAQNKDVCNVMHIGLVYACGCDDPTTGEITIDASCLSGNGKAVKACIKHIIKEAAN